jgi:dephospho-CoA kinase
MPIGVVHDLYAPGAPGSVAVAHLFGAALLDAEGAVDRDRLGRSVLGDPASRRTLESAIHPLVREAVDVWVAEQGDADLVVVEAALLVETGSWQLYDALAVVWCRREQQLERAVARGMDRQRATAILDAQADLDRRFEVADVAVDNTGDPAALEARVECALSCLRKVCERRRGRDALC